jgi:hypothetical protein
MLLYEKALQEILKNKHLRQENKWPGIPYPFPRLCEYLPIIEKGHSIGILGATGSGKSRFCRFVYVYHIYRFYKETGYKVKIILLSLEDNKEKVMKSIICHYLKETHGISITLKDLDSKEKELPDHITEKLMGAIEYFKEFEQVVSIIDGAQNPDTILSLCGDIAKKLGSTKLYKMNVEGVEVQQKKYESDTHVICITDNMSNIDIAHANELEMNSLLRFAKDIVREKLCNQLGWTVVQILQQDFQSERQQFTSSGQTIVSKLEPSLATIGDSKRVARSMHLIFGLFNPSRYELISYPHPPKSDPENCYRIDILGNRFRSLRVIKSNDSDVGMRIPLRFDGISEIFEELPLPKTEEIKKIYESLTEKRYQPINNNPNLAKLTGPEEEDVF